MVIEVMGVQPNSVFLREKGSEDGNSDIFVNSVHANNRRKMEECLPSLFASLEVLQAHFPR